MGGVGSRDWLTTSMAAVTLPMVSTRPEVLCQLMGVRAQKKLCFSLELCVVGMNVVGQLCFPRLARRTWSYRGGCPVRRLPQPHSLRAFQCSHLLCSWCSKSASAVIRAGTSAALWGSNLLQIGCTALGKDRVIFYFQN